MSDVLREMAGGLLQTVGGIRLTLRRDRRNSRWRPPTVRDAAVVSSFEGRGHPAGCVSDVLDMGLHVQERCLEVLDRPGARFRRSCHRLYPHRIHNPVRRLDMGRG